LPWIAQATQREISQRNSRSVVDPAQTIFTGGYRQPFNKKDEFRLSQPIRFQPKTEGKTKAFNTG
jgi:hypothetical protein